MTQAEKIGHVKGLGDIYQVGLPLDEQIEAFHKKGIELPYLPTPEEVAMIRLAEVSNDWSRTSMTAVARKGEPTVLTKIPLLMNPIEARRIVNAHRNARYATTSNETYDIVRGIAESQSNFEPEDKTAHVLSQQGNYQLTPEMEDTRFILGKATGTYFDTNNHEEIPFWDLPTSSAKEVTINYLGLDVPRDGSGVYARGMGSDGHYRALGVLRRIAEGDSQNSGRYDLTTIKNANSSVIPIVLHEVGAPALENILAQPLNDALLEELRKR